MKSLESLPMAEAVLCFSHMGTQKGKVTAEECYLEIDRAWKELHGVSLEFKLHAMLYDGGDIDPSLMKTEDYIVSLLLNMFRGGEKVDAVSNIIAISNCIDWMSFKHRLSIVSEHTRQAMIAEMKDRQSCGDYDYIPNDYRIFYLQNLRSVVIPPYFQRITQGFFQGFSGIEDITVPEIITAIEYRAFADCSNLKRVYIPSAVRELSSGAFICCESLECITVAEDNDVYSSDNNCVIRKSDHALMVGCKNSQIPEGVTRIIHEAFSGCLHLTKIHLPDSLIEIGDSVFAYCTSLKEIDIPESVELVDIRAFKHCKGLETIIIRGCPKIEYEAFAECWNTKTVKCLSDNLIHAHPTSFHITREVANFDLKSDIYWSSDGYESFE